MSQAQEKKKVSVARVRFVITTENGTRAFDEGSIVPEDVAEMYPQNLVGAKVPAARKHDPTLPQRLSKSAADKMSAEKLKAWIEQYHGGVQVPVNATKDQLVDAVMELQM